MSETILKKGDKVEVRWPQYDPDDWAPATVRRAQVMKGRTYYVVDEYSSYFPPTSIRPLRQFPQERTLVSTTAAETPVAASPNADFPQGGAE